MMRQVRCTGRIVVAALAVGIASAATVSAQDVRSNTQGLMVGLNLNGASLRVEDEDRQAGGGVGILIGYAPSRRIGIFLRGDVSEVEIPIDAEFDASYALFLVDLGVRFSFGGPEKAFIPYVLAALTAQTAADEVFVTPALSADVSIRGGGLTLGGGFDYFFSRTLALDVGLLATPGRFTEIEIGSFSSEIDSLDSMAVRFEIGINWFPIVR